MPISNISRHVLSIYAESILSLQTFQATAGLEFKCRFFVF